jgi:HisA/HisF family protein
VKLIPVIDLAGGAVVRAVRGERARYRPIVSRLCNGHDPADIAIALAEYCAADTLYIADLDAIRGGALQHDALARVAHAVPTCKLWLDAGFVTVADAERVQTTRIEAVLGSESLASRAELRRLAGRDDLLLSLDRKGGRPLDPAGCWQHAECWPGRVIVMTLDRVGAASGPDLTTLGAVRARAAGRQLIGAGGVRNDEDLRAAGDAGAAAWLVASALHDGTLGPVRG